jgi:integrase
MPMEIWPDDLRRRFQKNALTEAQERRLRYALGRWLELSNDLCVDAYDVSRQTWMARTEGLSRARQNEVRQALAIVFPQTTAALYSDDNERSDRPDERLSLQSVIARTMARFPPEWERAASQLLHVDPSGLGDGILVQAWAPSTIKRRLEAAAHHFDYCRARGFVVDISATSIRAKLREDQARVEARDRRLGGVSADLEALVGLATAVQPDRSWTWLKTARDRIKKLASHRGSRNAARAVNAAELRAAGQQLLEKADAAHAAAQHRRDLVRAHTRARTALTMILLSEAPIRITSCASLELEASLLSDLNGLYLDAAQTKEGDNDHRAFSATLIDAMKRYIDVHRAVICAPGETRLFVGERGGPVKVSQLSNCIGDFTEPVFKVRVTPHAIRHSVANFIVATAPEEAALASTILRHRSNAMTPIYTQRADQIIASRRLHAATELCGLELGAQTSPTRQGQKRPKARKRPREVRRNTTGRSRKRL